jgi:predicted CXXCH cytochrome family protein
VLHAMSTVRLAAVSAAFLCMGTAVLGDPTRPVPAATATAASDGGPQYVGGQACAECHRREYEAWRGSHHALAMEEATKATVLGDFNNARFTYGGVTSTFFTRAGKFYVRTDGPDGKLHDYEIRYTFGIAPLQQYLIPFPDGRLQALSICWDTRPKEQGGQRWFHLYPNEIVDFQDALHWTGAYQNWNYMCSECHSTNVRKNYDADADRFATTWSEIDVSCEACHGPGSRHVEWGRRVKVPPLKKGGEGGFESLPEIPLNPPLRQGSGHAFPKGEPSFKGLAVDLAARGGSWVFEGSAPIAHLNGPRDTRQQVICARCHARRTQMGEDYDYSQALGQTHMLALLEPGLYHADGQILDEVFEYGSFLQSRMHERGVVCTDCHDPHSGQLRAAGNAVCAKCHQPSHFDTPSHHHHKPDTKAAGCVQCHMLARNYMVVHTRHDHSFRVPRPDLSVTLKTPDTCTDCHHDRTARWAADAVVKWYGPTRTRGPRWAAALAAGRQHAAGADKLLTDVIADRSFPVIVRATAVNLLDNFPGAASAVVARAVQDEDPLVRRAAVSLLQAWEPQPRWETGAPLLSDPIRVVRIAAVSALADVLAAVSPPPEQRSAFESAAAEYRAMQHFNADRGEAWLNLGVLDARLGNFASAEAAYQRAIRMQPLFIPPYVNLADVYRQEGREADGEGILRRALAMHPPTGDVHHALGLLLVREKRMPEAVSELAKAAEESPENPRYAYVYGVALGSVGQHGAALAFLEQAHQHFTGDRDILSALVEFSRETKDQAAAARWAQELRQLQEGPQPPSNEAQP